MSAPSPSLRIGNDEREAAIKALDEHLTAGRLDAEEYGQRVAQASIARTREGIDELFTDLPAPHPFPPATPTWQAPSWRRTGAGPDGGTRAVADRTFRQFAGQSVLVRLALLVLAAVVIIVALPFVIVAGVLIFIVLPMLGLGGFRHGRWQGGRIRARGRW
jgi:uncharacterized protein DUF1707